MAYASTAESRNLILLNMRLARQRMAYLLLGSGHKMHYTDCQIRKKRSKHTSTLTWTLKSLMFTPLRPVVLTLERGREGFSKY